MTRRFSKGLFY